MKPSIGERFGRWTVIAESKKYGYVVCQCECGTIKDIWYHNLLSGRSKSCGCLKSEKSRLPGRNPRFQDLTGQQFGEWLVLYRAEDKNHQTMWHCRCSCGMERDVNGGRLKDGQSRSCGHSDNLIGQQIGKWFVLEKSSRIRPNGHSCSTYLCRCECGTERFVDANSLIQGTSLSCGCVNSHGQEQISKILSDLRIQYDTEVSFDDLFGTSRPLRFDFALYDHDILKGLVEFQGKQHYIQDQNPNFGKYQREISDSKKREYCEKNGIKLFEIRYDDDLEMEVKRIIEVLHVNPVPSVTS